MPAPNAINPRTGKRFDFVDPAHQDRETIELRKHVKLLERQAAALEARDRFMPFIKFTSPDPEDPNDCKKSKYKNARHHDALARVLEEVEKANIPFLILCMPPRHGKSEQVSRRFPAWYIGRHPSQNVIVATYSDTFAEDFGAEVRSIMNAPAFKQIFPNVKLQRGGTAKDRLQTTEGGMLFFVGRGGGLTGRGGHVLICDDLIKDDKEANSPAIRNQAWNWLTKVAMTRLGFAALYQQRPSLLDGDLFKRENVRYYTKDERPEELRMYAASDHALGAQQRNDPTLLITVGISKQNDIYIMPKIFWRRAPTDIVGEAMLDMAHDQKPLLWWAGRDHITKSMGPFLRKRMNERETYINLREMPTIGDKVQGAQSIIGRFAMGKVYWPKGEDWVERAINELMGFPNALHDEWADVLGLIGRGLQSQFKPGTPAAKLKKEPAFGTIAWMKRNDTWAKEKAAEQAAGGF
ncbi:terminase large subunit domain-containing protein [Bradyrhizobium liaoningense]|uniref:terminase large subunit domain-containing protein n=1 Tax=Bradyrhizobium liaoningense TaxID=43992 RepID=UPI0004B77447|nr:terminase family protein [Bradyrhizobium liaoningense]